MKPKGRNRLNLALLAAVALLAALSYWKPGTQRPAPAVPMITLKAAEVRDIRIALPGQKPMELKLGDRGWQMTAPLAMPADQNLVRTLLDYLDAESETRFPAAGTDLANYGLDKPKVRLWLNGVGYAFGELQPVNHLQYVLAGDSIHLVNGALFYRVAHDAYWWLDKRLLPAGTRLTALQLPRATLTLDKHGAWQLSPGDASVSADDIQRLISAWQQALAISVAPMGKAPEQGEVSFSLAGAEQPLRFAILKDADFLVLARPDLELQYELDPSQRDTLLSLEHPQAAAVQH